MNQVVSWLERYVLPVAGRIGQVRWLVALRDAFVSTMPVTIAGSAAMLIRSLIIAAKVHWHWDLFSLLLTPVAKISDIVWQGTFSLFAIYFALTWGYQLARAYEVDPLAGSIVSLASFASSIANLVTIRNSGKIINVEHAFDTSQMSTTGLFAAILFGAIGVSLFILAVKLRISLHLGTTNMPRAQQAAFEALIPSIIAIFVVAGINYLFQLLTRDYFGSWLLHSLQMPLIRLGQGFGVILLLTFLIQLFWFFGINGISVLAPVLESIWLTAQNANITAAQIGKRMPFTWVRGSFNAFAWFGGSGGTLMLLLAILAFSKKSDSRMLAKLALAPSLFNIEEPVVYGLPIAFNPVYFIPFVVSPVVNVSLAYWVTQIGWVNPVQAAVPSILPTPFAAYLACNYDWRAIVLSFVNMLISFLIYLPFIFAADKIEDQGQERTFFNIEY